MTNGTDSDSLPVADPTPEGDGGTRWPTWSDISRLHHIPSATAGEVETSSAPAASDDAPTSSDADADAASSSDEPTLEASSTATPGEVAPADRALSATAPSPAVPTQNRPSGTASTETAVEAPVAETPSTDTTSAETPATDTPSAETPSAEAATAGARTDGQDSEPTTAEAAPTETAAAEPAIVATAARSDEPSAAAAADEDAPTEAEAATEADDAGPTPTVDDVPNPAEAGSAQVATAEASETPTTRAASTPLTDVEPAATTAVAHEASVGTTAALPTTDQPSAAGASAPPDAPELPGDQAEGAGADGPHTAAAATSVEAQVPPRTSAFPATSAGGSSSPRVSAGSIPVARREPSVLDDFEPDDGRRRWPRQLAIALGIVVVLVGAYAGACYAFGQRVPRGATVAGVDIGGLTEVAAVDRLTSRLGPATTGSLAVKAGDQQSQLDPVGAGLTFDADATVRRLVGVDLLQPARLWNQVVGVGAQPAVTTVDGNALHTAVQQLADSLQVDPVNGSIVFADGTAHATPAQDGTDVDVAVAEKVIRDGWLVGARPLVLPTRTVAPDITQAETDAALTEVAQRVAGAPVTVAVADRTVSLPASMLVANASFAAQDGKLVLQMNGPALVAAVLAQTTGLVTPAADAHFEFQNDAPVLVPGTPGTTIDPTTLASAVAAAASSPNKRTATVQLVPSDPSQSTEALQALGVKEIVSEFATPLTSEPHRTVNITLGAAKINGVLVKPGDTFSLVSALDPVDRAHGYVDAGAIVDGGHVDALGGGLSQISTTTFNAAYFAGFEDVTHTPHSEWFTRYPEGREATIFLPTLDMKWKNTTPYGALIQAWVADNQVHVRIWGTKYWTVTSTTSPRSNVHAPTTVYSQSPTCKPQFAGNPGFTVTVTRQLSLNGEVKGTTSRTTTYKAQDAIVCGPTPSAAP